MPLPSSEMCKEGLVVVPAACGHRERLSTETPPSTRQASLSPDRVALPVRGSWGFGPLCALRNWLPDRLGRKVLDVALSASTSASSSKVSWKSSSSRLPSKSESAGTRGRRERWEQPTASCSFEELPHLIPPAGGEDEEEAHRRSGVPQHATAETSATVATSTSEWLGIR